MDFDLGMGSLEYKQNSGILFFVEAISLLVERAGNRTSGAEDDGELGSTLGTSMCRVGGGWGGICLGVSLSCVGLSFYLHGWVCGFLARIIVIAHSSFCCCLLLYRVVRL